MYIHLNMKHGKPSDQRSLTSDARSMVRDCPIMKLRRAARTVSHDLDLALRAVGLNAAQLWLMAQIAGATDDTIAALAVRCGLDQSTLSRNLQALARMGLVEVAMVEKDLRKRAVWLTESGARRLASAIPVWRKANHALVKRIDAGALCAVLEELQVDASAHA